MEHWDDALRQHRLENFAVTIKPLPKQLALFDNEMVLSVTHNGHQSASIALSPREAETLLDELQEYLFMHDAAPTPSQGEKSNERRPKTT